MQTEVHVFAFSISANLLLSFFPFLIVIVSLCQGVLHWRGASDAVYIALADYFPDRLGQFISNNLKVTVASRGGFQIVSVLLLLFTANGVFEPMEVALNRVFGCTTNRSYFRNQIVSLGLIFACGGLAMISTMLTALNTQIVGNAFGVTGPVFTFAGRVLFNVAAIPISMLMLFLIYWLLPNCKVRPRQIVPAAVGVGLLLEILKYVNLLTWPWLREKLRSEYGPFYYSVTILLWGFLASLLVLGGAEWAARRTSVSLTETAPEP